MNGMVTERSVRWPGYYTVVLLLSAAVFISYIDRTNISVAAIAMQGQFGWNETQKGLVLSSFFIGYLPLMIVSGTMAMTVSHSAAGRRCMRQKMQLITVMPR